MTTAIITGVIFSMITFFLSFLVDTKEPLVKLPSFLYDRNRKKNSDCCAHPPRSGRC
jgi:hypothetical protein